MAGSVTVSAIWDQNEYERRVNEGLPRRISMKGSNLFYANRISFEAMLEECKNAQKGLRVKSMGVAAEGREGHATPTASTPCRVPTPAFFTQQHHVHAPRLPVQ